MTDAESIARLMDEVPERLCADKDKADWFPFCTISTRWDRDVSALLLSFPFATEAKCRAWGLRNLTSNWTFGIYYEKPFRYVRGSELLHLEGSLMTYDLAILSGSRFREAFPDAKEIFAAEAQTIRERVG